MLYLRILLMLLIQFATLSCNGNETVKYYRHIDTEGKDPIIGKYLIDEEQAISFSCYKFIYNEDEKLIKIEYLRDGELHRDPYLGVAQMIIFYSDDAEIRSYKDKSGESTPDTTGVFRVHRKYDPINNTILTTNISSLGFVKDKLGVVGYFAQLNENGLPIVHYYLDENKDTIESILGVYEVRFKYDQNKNVIEIQNFDSTGTLIQDELLGWAIAKNIYDLNGNLVESRLYNADESPLNINNSYAALSFRKYNKKGNLTELNYLNSDEKLLQRFIFDEKGNLSESWNPITVLKIDDYAATGVDYFRIKYNSSGRLSEGSYYDCDLNLKERDDDGIAMQKHYYNSKNQITELICFGVNGKRKNSKRLGYASYTCLYDDEGNLAEWKFFDAHGKLFEDEEYGASILHFEYDKNGRKIKTICIDKNGKKVSEIMHD